MAGARQLQDRSCPVFAVQGVPDFAGDCQCQASQPYCFQDGRKLCVRSDGRFDLHYFAVSCQTCLCQETLENDGSSEPGSQSTCASAAGAEDLVAVPDSAGLCYCPGGRPLCISTPGETLGCLAAGTWGSDTTAPASSTESNLAAFPAGCPADSCVCRAMCPSFSEQSFADRLGDCACPSSAPLCHEDNMQGCRSATGSISRAYFASSCSGCECVEHVEGQCDIRSCLDTTDCIFSICRDCDICQGITRCPTPAGESTITLPDWSGNCKCNGGEVCYEAGSITPGCPIAPSGRSQFSFQVTCMDCVCGEAPEASGGGVKCPKFARDNLPGFSGDCVCPDDMPDCYKNGLRWCFRTDGQRDLHYFDPGCLDCECRAALQLNSTDEVKPCPGFAKFPVSNPFQNCICPDEQPVCIQADGAAAPGRAGPYCRAAQGWDSSTEFRHDCASCSCVVMDGEGSRLRDFAPEELVSGDDYVRIDVAFDIRLVNTQNSLQDWSLVSAGVLLSEPSRQAVASSAAYAVGFHVPVLGLCEDLTNVAGRTVDGGDYEDVRIHRLFAKLGVMFAEQRNSSTGRRLAASHHHVRSLQSLSVKPLSQLTLNEREQLLSLSTVFRPGLFGQMLELEMQMILNETSNWHPSPGLIQAPRVSVSRAVVTSDLQGLPVLEVTGPLEPTPPQTENLQASPGFEPEVPEQQGDGGENLMSLVIVGIVVGSLLIGLPLLCCFARRLRRCIRRRRGQKEGSGSPRSPGGSPRGSPRSPRGSPRSPRGSPRSPGQLASPRSARNAPPTTAAQQATTPKSPGGQQAGTSPAAKASSVKITLAEPKSVFDKAKRKESQEEDLAWRQKMKQKTSSAAASAAITADEESGKGTREKKSIMGRMRGRGKDKDKAKDKEKDKQSSNQSPRGGSPRSPR
ncbi:unnamed protein product [Effrenium voratum]|uniref:Uncharacterized protein n=1 Tax=Effrenium voratum TaxID=2562239 RepID=A0AA36HYA4_9DINO|nr:unnamed protein product [Effrenium voratum]